MNAKTQKIVDDIAKGKLNIVDLAERHGVSRQYIHQLAAAHVPNYKEKLVDLREKRTSNRVAAKTADKKEVRKERQELTKERVTMASLLWKSGIATTEFARLMGLTVGSAYMFVDRMRKQKGEKFFPFRKARQTAK